MYIFFTHILAYIATFKLFINKSQLVFLPLLNLYKFLKAELSYKKLVLIFLLVINFFILAIKILIIFLYLSKFFYCIIRIFVIQL